MSYNMCTVSTKRTNVPGTVISQTDDGLSSLQAKYCHWNMFVRSTSSWLTPVKNNRTTNKWLQSMLINWTHFPTFLGIPVSDQDRTAQVASFCTVAPNICESSVRNTFHATLLAPDTLRRLPDFWKFINPCTKSSITLHTNLYCKTNDTKIRTTTTYAHGHKTNNPNQLWEQQNMKHNYYCTVDYNVMKLSTWCLKRYTTVAFHFLKINHIIPVKSEWRGMGKGQCIHAITGTGGLIWLY